MPIIIVHRSETESYSLKLREPGFSEYAFAACMVTENGRMDKLNIGKFLIDTCGIDNELDIDFIRKDVKLLASAALEAYYLIEIYSTELKKK